MRGRKPNQDRQKRFRLQTLIIQQRADTCQVWEGTLDATGYGRIWFEGRWRLVHSVVWEIAHGPLPPGYVLDHHRLNVGLLCCRACINLAHLEPVTNRENVLRGHGACARHARQTHCKRGHEFTSNSTQVYMDPRGRARRVCRPCAEVKEQR